MCELRGVVSHVCMRFAYCMVSVFGSARAGAQLAGRVGGEVGSMNVNVCVRTSLAACLQGRSGRAGG